MITIIIPAYQAEKWINRSIDSVIAQSFDKWELIVVNDGSTDRTEELVSDYTKRDTRIRLISQKNMGVCEARNRGMSEAKGDYILFLDADDTIGSSMLERFAKVLSDNQDCDIVVSDFDICGERGIIEKRSAALEAGLYGESEKWKLFMAISDVNIAHKIGTQLYSARILGNVGFDKRYAIYEDVKFSLEAFREASKIFYLKEVQYTYYVDITSSLSYGYKKNYFDAILSYFEELGKCLNIDGTKSFGDNRDLWYYREYVSLMREVMNNSLADSDKDSFKNTFVKVQKTENTKRACKMLLGNNEISLKEKLLCYIFVNGRAWMLRLLWMYK